MTTARERARELWERHLVVVLFLLAMAPLWAAAVIVELGL